MLYKILLEAHSGVRYLVLLLLIVVIVKSLMGLINKRPFAKGDNLLSLFLLIFTHIQLLLGLFLYFVSPRVNFGPEAMTDYYRYFTAEHITGMLVAVVLITIARSTSKRMTDPAAKHKRLFLFNTIALVIILIVLVLGGVKIVGR
ncbi:cytochrome B [Dawidia soli]|uniref:Cytochrome B n=1 Tax=Dawidia soli TaxID=2782352 RepID=A0AAP2GDN6_9BACT|nr:cytochrome B [Dawidia soli]MBT1687487.1 cytochrome B [Dawidia soli]